MADLSFNNRVTKLYSNAEIEEGIFGIAVKTSTNYVGAEVSEEALWNGTQSMVETSTFVVVSEVNFEELKYNVQQSALILQAELWEEPLYQETPLAMITTVETVAEVNTEELQYEIKTSEIYANADIQEEPLWEGRQSMVESSKVSVLAEVYGDPLYSKFNIYVGTVKVENIYSGNDEIQNLDINK